MKILYVWEFGAGISRVARFMPVAVAMRERGWEVTFAIPSLTDYIKDVEALITGQGFNFMRTAGAPTLSRNLEVRCYPELILALPGFQDENAFTFLLRTWLSILDAEQPDLVFCDTAPVAGFAARLCGIATVGLDIGYFFAEAGDEHAYWPTRYYGLASEMSETEQRAYVLQAEQRLLNLVNRGVNRLNLPPVLSYAELVATDKRMLFTDPELLVFERRSHHDLWGTPQVVSPSVNKSGQRVFCYLHLASPMTGFVLGVLNELTQYQFDLLLLGASDKLVASLQRDHIQVHRDPLMIPELMAASSVTIGHGGLGFVSQALRGGLPMLLLPYENGQAAIARRAVAIGAAISLPEGCTPQLMGAYLATLFTNSRYRNQACSYRDRNQALDCRRVIEAVSALVEHTAERRLMTSKSSPGWIRRNAGEQVFADYDVVFLSYDEPNADDNWHQLQKLTSNAIRVHGVKGFDAAHKAAGEAARTERFILVDADNLPDPEFFNIRHNIPPHMEHSVWQWCSVNDVTGLIYPFGGLKVWTKEVVAQMRTHEQCTDSNSPLAIDFWNQPCYQIFNSVYSRNYTNGSPYQAFRAGYREAVKLGRLNGAVRTPADVVRYAGNPEIRRMAVWMSAGADADNGYWSLLGARQGFFSLFEQSFDLKEVNSYDRFEQLWNEVFGRLTDPETVTATDHGRRRCVVDTPQLRSAVIELGDQIRSLISLPPVIDMDAAQSAQFKAAMLNNRRRDEHPFTPVYGSTSL